MKKSKKPKRMVELIIKGIGPSRPSTRTTGICRELLDVQFGPNLKPITGRSFIDTSMDNYGDWEKIESILEEKNDDEFLYAHGEIVQRKGKTILNVDTALTDLELFNDKDLPIA